MVRRVSSRSPSFSVASNRISRFPRLFDFPHRLATRPRVSPNPHLPGAGNGSSSFLESRILRLCLRRSAGFPGDLLKQRLSMIPRVSPVPRSSGGAGDGSSSFLESRILQRYWRREAPGCPESSLLQHRLLMSLRVSPDPRSSGCADGKFSGIPESLSIGCLQWVDLQVSSDPVPSGGSVYASWSVPKSCINGWVDDDSPA